MYTVQWHEVRSLRCEPSKLFSSCETETLSPLSPNCPFPTRLSLWHLLFYFLSLWIWRLWVPRMSGITGRVFLWLVYFTSYNVSRVHPHWSMCQNSLPFSGRLTFHCVYASHFVSPFVRQWTSGLLPTFGYWELTLLWTWVYGYLFGSLFCFFGVYSQQWHCWTM